MMKIKVLRYILKKMPWQQLKDIMIEALNHLPHGCRDLVIREIVARYCGGYHMHRNPKRA